MLSMLPRGGQLDKRRLEQEKKRLAMRFGKNAVGKENRRRECDEAWKKRKGERELLDHLELKNGNKSDRDWKLRLSICGRDSLLRTGRGSENTERWC